MFYYKFEERENFFQSINHKKIKIKSKNKVKYYNVACTFDIESTSAYLDKNNNNVIGANEVVKMKENNSNFNEENYEKIAFMYIWQMSLNDKLIVGRTWEEFNIFMNDLSEFLELSENKRLIIFVRNLAFEFNFIKHYFTWTDVFASDSHKVIYGKTSNGFEFRCSYFLSNASLETTGKNLVKYKAEKRTGDLDYNLIRTSKTELTEKEIEYCLYDVIVDSNFIKESMEQEKGESLLKMPLTKTGYVRRHCREYCFQEKYKYDYMKVMEKFTLNEKLYYQLKRAFAGGFTHALAINSGLVFNNVKSKDFTSSYPAVLLMEKYPMSKGLPYKVKDKEDLYKQLKLYCCLFDVTFINIRPKKDIFENILSVSKCFDIEECEENNGRVVKAKKISTTITDIDFRCIEKFYDYDNIKVANFIRYEKGYLPKPLLECILTFYKDKTELKDVEGKEVEYMLAKGMLNAIFGMMVTDPLHDEIILENDTWIKEMPDTEKSLNHFNKSRKRFLAYEWGVWCTAYARRNLFSAVLELGEDLIYCDTDSCKFINEEKHKKYFEEYNEIIDKKIKKIVEKYNFEYNDFMPKTKKNEIKKIGIWDDDGYYKRFKTLGAKRYMYENEKGVNLTVSGINKKRAIPYLIELAQKENKSIFDLFDEDLYVPGEYSGKMLHSYIENPIELIVEDYQGNITKVKELSSVHLENSSYSLTISEVYKKYLKKIKTNYERL